MFDDEEGGWSACALELNVAVSVNWFAAATCGVVDVLTERCYPQKLFFFFSVPSRSVSVGNDTFNRSPIVFPVCLPTTTRTRAKTGRRELAKGNARQIAKQTSRAVVSATVIRWIGIDRTEDLRFNSFPTFRFVHACPSRTTGSRRIRRSNTSSSILASPTNPYYCFSYHWWPPPWKRIIP